MPCNDVFFIFMKRKENSVFFGHRTNKQVGEKSHVIFLCLMLINCQMWIKNVEVKNIFRKKLLQNNLFFISVNK